MHIFETIEIICRSNQHILYAPGFQVCQDSHPKSGAFILAQPHSQNFFIAIPVQAYSKINCFIDHFRVLPDLKTIPSRQSDIHCPERRF